MKLVSATIYALRIPFVEAFSHSAKERSWSDAVVLRVRDDEGNEGFGEGVPRPYVTGETPDILMQHLARDLWPEVVGRDLPQIASAHALPTVDAFIPSPKIQGLIADNATRAALELAILDCGLRRQRLSIAQLLPPRREKVVYSGVLTAGSTEKALQHARQMKLIGLAQIKVKVGLGDDVARVKAIREVMGPDVSLRLDANGAWSLDQAIEVLNAVAPFNIASVEQPIPRGPVADLKRIRQSCPIPLMVDESLVTLADAEALIAEQAADYFNIRVSKCGGLYRSAEMGRRAIRAGIKIQIGSQVGETAILSAAGRHLAASLDEVAFIEGSYGTLLLTEDVSAETVRFGHRGEAPLLRGPGLGVRVLEERLRRYGQSVVELS